MWETVRAAHADNAFPCFGAQRNNAPRCTIARQGVVQRRGRAGFTFSIDANNTWQNASETARQNLAMFAPSTTEARNVCPTLAMTYREQKSRQAQEALEWPEGKGENASCGTVFAVHSRPFQSHCEKKFGRARPT